MKICNNPSVNRKPTNLSVRLANRTRIGRKRHAHTAMSFIWEHSSAYRALVRATAGSKLAMGVFSFTAMIALPSVGAYVIMGATNPTDAVEVKRREDLLRARGTMESRMTVSANKRRLGEMLAEVRAGGGEEYKRAMGVSTASSAPGNDKKKK